MIRSSAAAVLDSSDTMGSSPSDDLLRRLADTGAAPELLAKGASVGRFEIERVLGRGGMGVVYLARDTRLHRDVALKVLDGAHVADAGRRARLLREAKAAAAVDHPSVARILEVFEIPGDVVALVFEHVPGRTLRDRLRDGEAHSFGEILSLGRALAAALSAAHAAGLVHRDLKPENVMCLPDGTVKVLDFGLAKRASSEPRAEVSEIVTVEGDIVGTPGYMSPEQALGREVDARSDVFALGVVLFELAAGRRPFIGASRMETLVMTTRDPTPDVRALRPDLPLGFGALVASCMRKDPVARPSSASIVELALEELTLPEVPRRSRAWIPAVAVLVLVGGAAALAASGASAPSGAGAATPSSSPSFAPIDARLAEVASAPPMPVASSPAIASSSVAPQSSTAVSVTRAPAPSMTTTASSAVAGASAASTTPAATPSASTPSSTWTDPAYSERK